MKKERLWAHIGALAVMLGGASAILVLVIAMNDYAPPPEKAAEIKQTVFALQPKPQQPKIPQKRQEPKKAPKVRSAAAPKPSVLSSIAGPSFGLLALSAADILPSEAAFGGKNLIMTENSVDLPPAPQNRTSPAYPERARSRGVEGYVILNLLIDSRGSVESIRVLEASPSGVFEQAATQAVRAWTFTPASYKGENVRVWAKQIVRFNLS